MSDTLTYALVNMRRSTRQATHGIAVSSTAAFGVVVGAVTLAVYLLTLAPDLYSLDSPELTAAAWRLGIAHAPGYPLYTLAGWLFSHAFPIGTVAYRLNLLSALFAAAAALLVYAAALRLTSRPALAAAGALMLAFSYYFWADALAAEVYSLDAALFAGLLLAAMAWRQERTLPLAALAGLALGLGMATRTTTLLYLPALALFAWMSGERSPRTFAAAAGGMAAGLLFYLYLPLRSAAGGAIGPGDYATDGTLRVWDLATWGGFWQHVTASSFQGDAFAYSPLGALREAGVFGGRLASSFLIVGVPLGIAGAARQWRADRALFVLFAASAGAATLFFINYGAIDKEFMFLPAYVVWALWAVIGLDWAVDALPTGALGDARLPLAAALALPALALAVNLPLVSLRGEHRPRNEAEAFLAGVPQGAIVYGPFLDVAPFQYLQQVEGQRPDVALVNSWTVDERFLVALADANVGARPFFLTQDEPILHGRYALVRSGTGFEVRKKG